MMFEKLVKPIFRCQQVKNNKLIRCIPDTIAHLASTAQEATN